jgi:uncharacterized membrane protein
MIVVDVLLVLSTLTCALATGFILTFAIVVMPGLANLNDRDFITAFQVTDGVIQRGQPVFNLIWIGSVISIVCLMIAVTVGSDQSDGRLTALVGAMYLLGVQGVTIAIHLPLNRHIQKLHIADLDAQALREERVRFEEKWNAYNTLRTGFAVFVTVMLLTITASQ